MHGSAAELVIWLRFIVTIVTIYISIYTHTYI